MTEQHPITPTEELVEQWWNTMPGSSRGCLTKLATQAAQWGWDQRGAATESELQQRADQELEACCEWLDSQHHSTTWSSRIRAARRKPLIKADQALAVLNTAPKAGTPTVILDIDQFDTILLALGRMKELEAQP